jgi:hypothetical protein
MKPVLSVAYQVVYYNENGAQVYWPADTRSRRARGETPRSSRVRTERAAIADRRTFIR